MVTTMFGVGPTELIVVLFIILLLFGAKKIPEIAQGIGKGIAEFKKATRDVQDEVTRSIESDEVRKKDTSDRTPKS